jgi:hypothetical protein
LFSVRRGCRRSTRTPASTRRGRSALQSPQAESPDTAVANRRETTRRRLNRGGAAINDGRLNRAIRRDLPRLQDAHRSIRPVLVDAIPLLHPVVFSIDLPDGTNPFPAPGRANRTCQRPGITCGACSPPLSPATPSSGEGRARGDGLGWTAHSSAITVASDTRVDPDHRQMTGALMTVHTDFACGPRPQA